MMSSKPRHGRGTGLARAADTPLLPALAYTRDGQAIRPADAVWVLRKRKDGGGSFRLDWRKLRNLSPRMITLAKLILVGRMPQFAPISTLNDFSMLRRLSEWHVGEPLEWSAITQTVGERWLKHGCQHTANAGNDFARLRDLYRYGVKALRAVDFSAQTLLALETLRAPGNAKGNAVRNGDPEEGYFTPPEVDCILAALGNGHGTAEQRATVWLALELGRNTLQYTLLRNRDLVRVAGGEAGALPWLYQLHVTRVKKRTVTDAKMPWPISAALGDFLWSIRRGADDGPLLWWLGSEQPEWAMTALMHAWARSGPLISPRTGRTLHLNARRFRVTLLTNAADEGASAEHLMMLADHADLQNVQVYLDRSPLFLLRIQKRVDEIYSPLVRKFQGTFTTVHDAEVSGSHMIPGAAAQLPVLDVGGIGVCGKQAICRLAPPLSCYPCPHFVAFRDGPHVQVVAALEQAMAAMQPRVALQLANTLAAAREVVAHIATDTSARVAR